MPHVPCAGMLPPPLTFQVDDLPIPTIDTGMGTPPARATRGQWEEEEVPRLRLLHPVGHNIKVLTEQPLTEEECRCARNSCHCLGTPPCVTSSQVLWVQH